MKTLEQNIKQNTINQTQKLDIHIQKRFAKNILLDYIYNFIRNFDISSAIWVLYLDYRGMSLLQIGLLEGIFHVASMIFEVPSGAVADLFGRKRVMIVGRMFYVVSAILQITAGNFWLFAFAFILNALSYNLNSGTEEAFLYDTLEKLDQKDNYIKINGRMNTLLEISSAIATFVGGVLAQYSYVLCYSFVMIFGIISIFPALFFYDTNARVHFEKKEKDNKKKNRRKKEKIFLEHAKVCYDICRKDKQLVQVLLFFPMIDTFYAIMFFYGQKYFFDLRLERIQISFIMLFAGICASAGALCSTKVYGVWKENAKYLISVSIGVSIACLLFHHRIGSIFFFCMATFANAVLYPIQSTTLNERIPSKQRATILSVSSMVYSVFMVMFFPLSGGMAQVLGLDRIFGGLGILLVALAFFTWKSEKRQRIQKIRERNFDKECIGNKGDFYESRD